MNVLSERRVKLALVHKHGAEALLVKAFLAETNNGSGGGGGGDTGGYGNGGDGLGLCTETDIVSLV